MKQDPYRVIWPVKPNVRSKVFPDGRVPFKETPILLPTDVLLRHDARILDPSTATQPNLERRQADNSELGKDGPSRIAYEPTAYVANEVLASAAGRDSARIREFTNGLNDQLRRQKNFRNGSVQLRLPDPADLELTDRLVPSQSPAVVRLTIDYVPSDPPPGGPDQPTQDQPPLPDAWEVVQHLRDVLGASAGEIGLNHLMFASGLGGVGFTVGHSVGGIGFTVGHAIGVNEYAIPGMGGRAPVRWLGRPPQRSTVTRRPVVAILDTGVATHPWFEAPTSDPIVLRYFYDKPSGVVRPATTDAQGGETEPNLVDPLEGLIDPFFGHGTFIAGIIRQTCPDARLLSVKIMDNDGIVEEADLINAIGFIHQRQQKARKDGPDKDLVDILSLSLGYYHEATEEGIRYDTTLSYALDALGRQGILVVAAAGNNATTRPLLPAGFTPYRNGVLPDGATASLISVGALNPDGGVSLFSNSGDWIAAYSPGAALVSTLPIVDAGQRSGVDTGVGSLSERDIGSWRATIDPDSFTGFGTWSGTSFAAPAAAGAAAQALLDLALVANKGPEAADVVQRVLTQLGFGVTDEEEEDPA